MRHLITIGTVTSGFAIWYYLQMNELFILLVILALLLLFFIGNEVRIKENSESDLVELEKFREYIFYMIFACVGLFSLFIIYLIVGMISLLNVDAAIRYFLMLLLTYTGVAFILLKKY